MFLKKCVSKDWEARNKGRQGNKRPATDLGEGMVNIVCGNVPELPNIPFMVVIRRVLNHNNDLTSSMQFQASYTYVRHWVELINFTEKMCCPKEPYSLTALYKSNLVQEGLDEEYKALYIPRQMLNDPLCGQISYNSSPFKCL
jgi:hypothetical protein